MAKQCAEAVFLIKPRNFGFNEETSKTNHFQVKLLLDAKLFYDRVRCLHPSVMYFRFVCTIDFIHHDVTKTVRRNAESVATI